MPLVRKGASSPPPPPLDSGALTAGTSTERWAAARALSAASDAPALGAALATEEDARVREAILTSLCRIATPESAAIVAPLLRSDDAEIRRAALDALRSMPQAAATMLRHLLADEDADVRLLSCEIARELPSADATSLLCELLECELVPNVCTAAVDVLTETGTSDALPVLAAVARRYPDEAFLQFAVEAAIERLSASAEGLRG